MSVGTLHDIGCEGPADCHCAVVYVVREVREQAFDSWDNEQDEVASKLHTIESRAARSGELPLTGRASARDTGGRP